MGCAKTEKSVYPDIGDYAAIGNCRGMALIAGDGRVDWCALESVDASPTCFRLLDDNIGGYLDTRPGAAFQSSRRYVPHTNVLEETLTTAAGTVTLTDFMPLGREPSADAGTFVHVQALPWLVRIIHVTQGEVTLRLDMLPGVAWGRRRADVRPIDHGVAWEGGALLCDRPIDACDGRVHGVLDLKAGDTVRLVLMAGTGGRAAQVLSAVDTLLDVTLAYWKAWIGRCGYEGAYADAVERSALVLKLLTYAPTGAIVAAATTSLPEAMGGVRNWDYRLSWVRDSTLTLFALSALGYQEEPEAFRRFLFASGAGDIFPTQIVYGIHGETKLDECELSHLRGYRGSRPVRVGNAAHRQRQFDVYGEVMDWLMLRQELGGTLAHSEIEVLRRTADYVVAHWHEPGQGFWEERGPPEHFVYGKMMCWVALDRAQTLLGCRDYEATMRAIVDDVHRHGLAPRGYVRKCYGQDTIDAVGLRAPTIDFPLPAGCLEVTLDEAMAQLATSKGVFRYKGGDGLDGEEGTFVACGFWLVDALLFAGRHSEARRWLETLLQQANDVGLYAEEIDPDSGCFLGNFPQALSHLALIHSAMLLEFVEHSGSEALRGTHADRMQHAYRIMERANTAKKTVRADIAAADWRLDLQALGLSEYVAS